MEDTKPTPEEEPRVEENGWRKAAEEYEHGVILLDEFDPDSREKVDVDLMNMLYGALKVQGFAQLRLNKFIRRLRNERQKADTSSSLSAIEKRQKILPDQPKAILPLGKGATKFEGLHDRDLAKEDLYQGLEYLAKRRGDRALDKKDVPVLGISAPSESGKTEFLRWVFNECCTVSPDAGETAQEVLRRINVASPVNVPNLSRLLVLFASFNQQSPYSIGEGPIEVTTIERLVRSYEGRLDMQRFDAATSVLRSWNDLVEMFSKEGETTGFVVCIDELSKLRQVNPDEYPKLMDVLLSFSKYTIANGGYFAIVGSSLHIYDFGEVVLQASGRAMRQIKFPSNPDTMENKTRAFVIASQVFAGAAARVDEQHFFLKVALQVARSSPHMSFWLKVAESQTNVSIPQISYGIPDGIDADTVFLLAARTALKQQMREQVNRDKLDAVLDKLHGNAELHDAQGDGVHRRWPNVSVTLSLPPWRLLQFIFPQNNQVFSYVQNWVLVELYRLFYDDGPSEAVKTWELATMGVLELRKAMLHAVRGQTPSLRDVVDGKVVGEVGTFLKVSDDILDMTATEKTAANSFQDLPSGSDPCELPCFYYAKKSNEEGVEGVFRNGFGDLAIFFQMKLYHNATPDEIKDWLEKAHTRAQALGYKEGTYIVQLFVTGTINANVPKYQNNWPQNSMVFADNAIQHLFKPFGDGLFVEMVRRRRREN
ncbi:hypothetical protein ACA910_013941 [Epithemia clementina (nom. ined.)]